MPKAVPVTVTAKGDSSKKSGSGIGTLYVLSGVRATVPCTGAAQPVSMPHLHSPNGVGAAVGAKVSLGPRVGAVVGAKVGRADGHTNASSSATE
eukprot:scaffold12222_cov53-Prasinocladus_malaysianus.AAC.1